MESSMNKLSVDAATKKSTETSSKTKAPIVDSWEDAASDDTSSDAEPETEAQAQERETPGPPPPTPVSAAPLTYPAFPSQQSQTLDPYAPRPREGRTQPESAARPEKQTAVAGRLIAGALGVRAPKKTEEQRQYDKAVREKERKKREKAKEEERRGAEELEKAKREIWDS